MKEYSILKCMLLVSFVSYVSGTFVWNGQLPGTYSNQCRDASHISDGLVVFTPDKSREISSNIGREIIVSSVSSHGLPFAVNLMASMARIDFTEDFHQKVNFELLFISHDEETLRLCDRLYVPCWLPDSHLFSSNSSFVSTNRFQYRTMIMSQVIAVLLQNGFNVLKTEVTSVWLKSPYELLLSTSSAERNIQMPGTSFHDAAFYHVTSHINTTAFFLGSHRICHSMNRKWIMCFRERLSVNQHLIRYIGNSGYAAGGCAWKSMSKQEQQQAYIFYGSCGKKGFGGLLEFYDQYDMFRIRALRPEGRNKGGPRENSPTMTQVLLLATDDLTEVASRVSTLSDFLTAASVSM